MKTEKFDINKLGSKSATKAEAFDISRLGSTGEADPEFANKVKFETNKPLFQAAKELGISPIPKYEPGSAFKQSLATGKPTAPIDVFRESTSGDNYTKYLQTEIDKKLKETEISRQEIINFDTVAAEKEIADLEKKLSSMPSANWDTRGNIGQAQAQKNADAINRIKAQIAEKKINLAQKKRLQDLLKNNEAAANDPNFDKYVKSGSMSKEEFEALIMDAPAGNDELNAAMEALYVHQNNMDTNHYLTGKSMNFELMTDEEFDLLAYYIGKDKETGGNQAETYVELMKETLQTRKGQEIYEQ